MKRESESVSFIGLGYVGLCTAAVLASRGMKIIGVDIDGEKIAKLAKGETPLHEPRLASMLKSAIKNKRIQFTTDIDRVVEADVTFITVGTPSNQDGSISLTFVKKAAEDVGSAIRGADAYHLVVVKSTVIPGTTTGLVRPMLESSSRKPCGPKLGLCSNPEFLAEGSAITNTLHPDKIVIGKRRKIREQASEALPANLQGKEDSHCNNESDDSRDHQVCEQRIPRHSSQHNQYHRQHLPTPAIGRCRDRCKGDRLRPPDRVSLPQSWTRLRRFLLPQGPPSLNRVQPGPRLRPSPLDRSRRGQPPPSK